MYHHHHTINQAPLYVENIALIDIDFDRFEINSDLEAQLRESENATFYHGALDPRD